MADFVRESLDNWMLTANGSLEQHLEMIGTTLAKRAYELFENYAGANMASISRIG
jgi:hypothetical protein